MVLCQRSGTKLYNHRFRITQPDYNKTTMVFLPAGKQGEEAWSNHSLQLFVAIIRCNYALVSYANNQNLKRSSTAKVRELQDDGGFQPIGSI